jgi:hypothetical protein
MHKSALLAGVAILGLMAPGIANADVIINGIDYIDPTSFHVTATGATGSDPVLLNNNKSFSIQDVGGQNINTPLTVYIATPVGAPVPTISSASYLFDSQPATSVTVTANGLFSGTPFPTGSASDLYTYVGCVACDNSLNETNINAAYTADGLSTPASLSVYSFTANHAFQGKDEINFTGLFANGDIVFPFAQNVGNNQVTIFDTSWTNTGFVDCPPGGSCGPSPPPPPPPPPPPVPEPASLALLGTALLGLGLIRRCQRS